jgi:hypothetical protein
VNCQGASRLPWTREQRRSKELDNSEGCGVRRPVAAGITDGRATIPCRHRSARASESLVRPDNSQNQSSSTEMGCAGLILRLLWFIAGHLALVVFALLVAQRGRFSFLDLGYWLTIVFILAVRWVDVTRFGGQTSQGEPATLRDWGRHLVLLTLTGGGVWFLIHAGWRWFGR